MLVTGASSGLGNACATQLAKKGYSVYGTSRQPESRPRRVDEFYELIRMDMTDDDSVTSAVDYILAREGRIDALFHFAGSGIAGPVEETPIAEAAGQFDLICIGAARAIRAVLPGMRAQGGAIVLIGSMAGLIGIPFQAYYSAAKFALEGLVDSLRLELTGMPVQVSLIEPGDFRSGFTRARVRFGMGEKSPYAQKGQRAIAVMEKEEMTGGDPIKVARLALSLMTKRRLRPRYYVLPLSQRIIMALGLRLPRIVREMVLAAYFKVIPVKGH